MTIHTTDQNEEYEEEGKCSLMLVAVRYIGDKSTKPPGTIIRQAGWPGRSVFQGGNEDGDGRDPGSWQFGLIPDWTGDELEDRTMVGLESNPDFEWTRDPEEIAEAFLSLNYLPTNVFKEGFNQRARDEVFELLDLDYEGVVRKPEDEEVYREQLREIAGIELDDEEKEEIARSENRVNNYLSNYGYHDLRGAATELGIEDGRPEKREAAEYLAQQDPEEVNEVLD